MKKVVLSMVMVFALVLFTGCEEVTDFSDDVSSLNDEVLALQTQITEAKTALDELEGTVGEITEKNEELALENAALLEQMKTTNARIKNALNRDSWSTRKIGYNPDYTPYEAEYCFGVFDVDWSTITDSEYTHNGGLKFVITVESVMWGTEVFVKDSCGNYSEFIYANSSYSFYSVPNGLLEEGKTYEVVLYKEAYFSVDQLGLLPSADLEFGMYPTDLSNIVITEIE